MHHSAYVNAEKFYHKYCENNIENKKILDVGSYDVNGTMKPIFEKGQYTKSFLVLSLYLTSE
jgi:hypothetical protein